MCIDIYDDVVDLEDFGFNKNKDLSISWTNFILTSNEKVL